MKISSAVGALAALCAVPILALAQDPQPSVPPAAPPSSEEQKKLEEQIAEELGAAPPGAAQPPPPGGPRPGAPGAATGGSALGRVLLLPDISAIGSFAVGVGTLDVGELSERPGPVWSPNRPAFELQEVEVGLQAVVDPYARADVFLAFTGEGVDVEEAYVTTLALPAGLQVRAGKLFSPFGRFNQQHPHAWEFVDAPLAQHRLVAGESLGGAGVDVAWLAPLPWYAELRVAAQDTAPEEDAGAELTGVGRLSQFFSLSDATTLGVGVSAARRSEGAPGAFRDLGGADVYLRYRPAAWRGWLALQGEVYARRFRGVPDRPAGTDTGWWAQAFWRQGARWGYGARYEEAPAAAADLAGTERRASALLAWLPSEFQRLRLQVSWDRLPGGRDGLEALLHLEFGIGAHGAHPF